MTLVEPLALLQGPAASHAIEAGHALPLAGGPAAFALVRLLGDGAVVPVDRVPAAYRAALARVTAAPPQWADLPAGPQVMGVLNVTPDSFSDGGVNLDPGVAIEAGLAMAAAGAALIDVGGETTRPRSAPTPPDVERARILPVIKALAAQGVAVSVDTRNASTMAAALAAGARVVNDVSALAHDPDSVRVVAEAGCPVVLMHMRGTPDTMHAHVEYRDVALEVTRELAARVAHAVENGVEQTNIAVDPGVGFAKMAQENLDLLQDLPLLANLGCPILVGVSRKRFIGTITGEAIAQRRGAGSIAAGLWALHHGARLLRVHDVGESVAAVRVWRRLAGLE